MRIKSIALFTLIALQQTLLAEIEVSARFNPPRVAMGDNTQYIVEIKETSSTAQPQIERVNSLPIPEPGGLELRNGRTSSGQQTRFINGTAEYSVTQNLIIDATPPRVGRYTIPAYAFEYKGERYVAPAATLEVVERDADAGPTTDELVFLKAEIPESLYVGQTSTVELQLFIAEGVRLSGLNSFDRSADGFTISELPENYDESSGMLNGRRYSILKWPLTLTPIQTGPQKISFEFVITAQLPGQQRGRNSFGRSPFGGGLFDDLFGKSERMNVYTDVDAVNVLSLPEPQPDSFSGAIGEFSMEVGTDADATVQGEPIMLSVIIRGRGNFPRIEGPDFPNSPDWRNYDPEQQFEAMDEQELSGSKRFDYLFVPQRAGKLKLPETEFSYFDPSERKYIKLSAPSIEVPVSPAQNTFIPSPSIPLPESNGTELELSRTLTAEEALLTLDYRPKTGKTIGTGILASPIFIAFNAFSALTLVGASLLFARIRRNREDPTYPIRKAAKEFLKSEQASCLKALEKEEAGLFYKAAQSAIRHAATARTGHSMMSAESSEIAALLSEKTARQCNTLFEVADAHRFGGSSAKELASAKEQLDQILKEL
ncbi:MAG: BatD family protein [Verrucomicrobiota bacterium]